MALLLAVGAVSACSLLNTFSALKDRAQGDDADTDGGSDGGSPEANVLVPVTASRGVIVVSGEENSDGGAERGVLTALSPIDGTELPQARQYLNAATVRYDGLRDLWYIIESRGTSIFPVVGRRGSASPFRSSTRAPASGQRFV